MTNTLPLVLAATLLLATVAGAGQGEVQRPPDRAPTADEVAFFEKKIRPVLATKCYSCHSAKNAKPKGGLLLDTREGLRAGGDSGRAIIPGQPKKSLLIQALYQDKDLRMPPKEKLSETVIADFEQWVQMGAPDPRTGGTPLVRAEIDIAKGRQFWAFQPPRRHLPPPVRDTSWPRSDVDRFLLAGLEARGSRPVGDADPYTLIRRLYFDLIGLPPSPDEVESFVRDYRSASSPSQAALEKVVDRLLASPHFGERWGRHWLDVARYGETSGRQINFNYPFAWRYRNYVLASFNADKPFDRFIREQVAGDLLPAADARQRAEQQIATGWLAIGPKPHAERNLLQFQMDVVDEQIDAVSQAILGLSVACARCHDHKFDPIPQKDYYALAGIFRSTETCYGTIRVIQSLHPSPLLEFTAESGLSPGVEPLTGDERKDLQRQVAEIRARREKQTKAGLSITGQEFNRLAIAEGRLARYAADGTPKLLAVGVRERSAQLDSPLYIRGEVEKPGATVPRGLLQVLTLESAGLPTNQSGRLELANWLASQHNPLTARVFVNRVWLHLFGAGLVPTPDNFGAAGLPPSYPTLLDTLAVTFMEDGWSVKRLIRRLVLSRAYQLSTRYDAANFKADPDNALIWRMSPRRLEAEALRDALLAVSGELIRTPPASSPVAQAGEGPSNVLMRQLAQLDSREFHRAVYLPVLRDSIPESLALFDFADANQVVGQRVATNVPAQGLYLLNSPFVQARAEATANRLLTEKVESTDRLKRAFLLILGRPPTERQRQAAEQFLAAYPRVLARDNIAAGQQSKATWAALCQALLASADFLYRN